MEDQLRILLVKNHMDIDNVHMVLYNQILLNIFYRICDYLNIERNLNDFKSRLRTKNSKKTERMVYKNLIKEFTKLELDNEEIDILISHIDIYLSKENGRSNKTRNLRESLLKRQNFKCKLCGKDLKDDSSTHVDHIIPFKNVGDSLENNYQCLCQSCNCSKGARLIQFIDMICDKTI